MVEDMGLKIVASRSTAMASAYQISRNLQIGSKVIRGDTQAHTNRLVI
jgi:hypothetical protein